MDDREPTPPNDVPGTVATDLRELDDESLRTAIHYAQELLDARTQPTTAIEAQPGEEILSIQEHETYTAVIKQHDCEEGCSECPHGPHLYHVQAEEHIDGETVLDWTYIGRVQEP